MDHTPGPVSGVGMSGQILKDLKNSDSDTPSGAKIAAEACCVMLNSRGIASAERVLPLCLIRLSLDSAS